MADEPRPHFELTKNLINSMDKEEVKATMQALQECGLVALPFPEISIKVHMSAYWNAPGWIGLPPDDGLADRGIALCFGVGVPRDEQGLVYEAGRGMRVRLSTHVTIENDSGTWYQVDMATGATTGPLGNEPLPTDVRDALRSMAGNMTMLLIAALATKNTIQHTTLNKRAARGIGRGLMRSQNGMIFLSRTVVDAPPSGVDGSGRRMPRHFRRGHVHRFRTGVGKQGPIITKFLPPVWVNDALGGEAKTPNYKVEA